MAQKERESTGKRVDPIDEEYASRCGHPTHRYDQFTENGIMCLIKVPVDTHGRVEWCTHCLAKMTIHCPLCGYLIFVGDPVMFRVLPEDECTPKDAVIYRPKPRTIVRCLWHDEPISRGDEFGFWVPGTDGKGEVLPAKSFDDLSDGIHHPVIVSTREKPG